MPSMLRMSKKILEELMAEHNVRVIGMEGIVVETQSPWIWDWALGNSWQWNIWYTCLQITNLKHFILSPDMSNFYQPLFKWAI